MLASFHSLSTSLSKPRPSVAETAEKDQQKTRPVRADQEMRSLRLSSVRQHLPSREEPRVALTLLIEKFVAGDRFSLAAKQIIRSVSPRSKAFQLESVNMTGSTLTKEQEDVVLKEIGYSRAQLQRDIPSLRLWLQEQVHLPPSRLTESDIFLSNFLVGCKGSMETAKKKVDHYYSLRGKGEVFLNRDTLECLEITKHTSLVELPKPTPDNCAVWLTRLTDENIDIYSGQDVLKYALLLFEHRLRNGSGIPGQTYYVLDASQYTISHLMTVTPTVLRSFMSFFQEAYPIRVRRIIVTSAPSVLTTSINTIVLPFLNKKIRERFHITSEPTEKVFEHLDLLPNDYEGGKQKPLKELNGDWKFELSKLKDIAHQFKEETIESKRPQLKNGINDPYFGLHGSIKTLVLD